MQSILHNNNIKPIKIFLKSFDTLIKPILTYACEIWGQDLLHNTTTYTTHNMINDSSVIERIHLKFCKRILGVNTKSSNLAVRSELGRLPILGYVTNQVFSYYTRMEASTQVRLTKIVYESLKNEKWHLSKTGKHLTDKLDLEVTEDTFSNKNNLIKFCNNFKLNLNFKLQDDWYTLINNKQGVTKKGGNKLRTYARFKHALRLEDYLINIKNPDFRKSLTKFRISAHCLAIEKGRYKKNTPNQPDPRLCKYCNSQTAETEEHFLLECEQYNNERDTYLPNFSSQNMTTNFKTIMESSNENDQRNLAKMIYTFLNVRMKSTSTQT